MAALIKNDELVSGINVTPLSDIDIYADHFLDHSSGHLPKRH